MLICVVSLFFCSSVLRNQLDSSILWQLLRNPYIRGKLNLGFIDSRIHEYQPRGWAESNPIESIESNSTGRIIIMARVRGKSGTGRKPSRKVIFPKDWVGARPYDRAGEADVCQMPALIAFQVRNTGESFFTSMHISSWIISSIGTRGTGNKESVWSGWLVWSV